MLSIGRHIVWHARCLAIFRRQQTGHVCAHHDKKSFSNYFFSARSTTLYAFASRFAFCEFSFRVRFALFVRSCTPYARNEQISETTIFYAFTESIFQFASMMLATTTIMAPTAQTPLTICLILFTNTLSLAFSAKEPENVVVFRRRRRMLPLSLLLLCFMKIF